MLGKMFFWTCIIVIIVCAYQNHFFDGVGSFMGMIKKDIDYQQNYVPDAPAKIDDHGGLLTVEEGEKKVTRRGAWGAIHNTNVNHVSN